MNYSFFSKKSQSQKLINSFSSFKNFFEIESRSLSSLYFLNLQNLSPVLLGKKQRNKNYLLFQQHEPFYFFKDFFNKSYNINGGGETSLFLLHDPVLDKKEIRTKKSLIKVRYILELLLKKSLILIMSNNSNTSLSPKRLFFKEINKTVVERNNYLIQLKTTAVKKILKQFIYRLTLRSDKAEKLNQQEMLIKLKKVLFLSLKNKNTLFFFIQQDANPSKKFIETDASYNKLEEILKLLLKEMQHEAKFILQIKIDSLFTKYLAKTLLGMSALKCKQTEINSKSLLLQNYKLFDYDKIKKLRKQSWQQKMFDFSINKKLFFGLKKNKWIKNYLSETTSNCFFKNKNFFKVCFCSIKYHKKKKWTSSSIQKWFLKFVTNRDLQNFIQKRTISNMTDSLSNNQKKKIKTKIRHPSDFILPNAEQTLLNLNKEKGNTFINIFDISQKYMKDSIYLKDQFSSFFDLLNLCIQKEIKKERTSIKTLTFKLNNSDTTYTDLNNFQVLREFLSKCLPSLVSYKDSVLKMSCKKELLLKKSPFTRILSSEIKSDIPFLVSNVKKLSTFKIKLTREEESNCIMFKKNKKRFYSNFFMHSYNNPIIANTFIDVTPFINGLNDFIQKENTDFLLKLALLDQAKNCFESRTNSHFISFDFLPFLNFVIKNKKENSNNFHYNKLRLNFYPVNEAFLLESNKLQNKINNMSHYFLLKAFVVNKLYPFSPNKINKEKINKYLFNNFPYLSSHLRSVKLSKIKKFNSSFYLKESYKFPFWLKKTFPFLVYKIIPFSFFEDSVFFKKFNKSSFLLTNKFYYTIKSLCEFLISRKAYLLNKHREKQAIPFPLSSSLHLDKKENISLLKTRFSSLFFKDPTRFSILSTAGNYQYATDFLNIHSNLNILSALQKWVNIYFSLFGFVLEKQNCQIIPSFSPFLINDYFLRINKIESSFLMRILNYIKDFKTTSNYFLYKRRTTKFKLSSVSFIKRRLICFLRRLSQNKSCGIKSIKFCLNRSYKNRKGAFVLQRKVYNTDEKRISANFTWLKKREILKTINTYLLKKKSNPILLYKKKNYFYILKKNNGKDIKNVIFFKDFDSVTSKLFSQEKIKIFSKTRTWITEADFFLNGIFKIKNNSLDRNYGLNFFGFNIFQTFTPRSLNQTNSKQKGLKERQKIFRNDSLNHSTTKKIKTFILPSQNKIQNQIEQIRQIIFFSKTKTKLQLINRLAPIIREWCYYYKIVKSQKINLYLDYLTLKIIWRWCCRRHPNKSHQWIKNKYFCQINGQKWVFGEYISMLSTFVCLPNHTDKF